MFKKASQNKWTSFLYHNYRDSDSSVMDNGRHGRAWTRGAEDWGWVLNLPLKLQCQGRVNSCNVSLFSL